jgi:hypothetical protein
MFLAGFSILFKKISHSFFEKFILALAKFNSQNFKSKCLKQPMPVTVWADLWSGEKLGAFC